MFAAIIILAIVLVALLGLGAAIFVIHANGVILDTLLGTSSAVIRATTWVIGQLANQL